ncbi:hypothetical protein [Kitasatospora sp. NPDC059571]|uniref:hypothetical protein n=1 Tax=Kitasatospora sp. NPDC059571 TaxID=3346871 RepID=UPI0036B8F0C8
MATPGRQELIDRIAGELAWWGCAVPDDPGVGDLTGITARAAADRARAVDSRAREAAALIEMAALPLAACHRLHGTAPHIQHWHLTHALFTLADARTHLTATTGDRPPCDELSPG